MSEFGESIASGGVSVAAQSTSIGTENSVSISSKNIGTSRFENQSKENMVSIDHGMDKSSPFARSNSMEKIANNNTPMFDLKNPIEKDPISYEKLTAKHDNNNQEEKLIDLFGPKIDRVESPFPQHRVEDLSLLMKDSYVLWKKPKVENPAIKIQKGNNSKQQLNERSKSSNENANKVTEVAENEDNLLSDEVTQMSINSPKTSSKEKIQQTIPENSEHNIYTHETVASHVAKASPVNNCEATTKAIAEIKETVRLMPQTEEATIELPPALLEARMQPEAQVLNITSLDEMVRTQVLSSTQTEAQPNTEPTNKGDIATNIEVLEKPKNIQKEQLTTNSKAEQIPQQENKKETSQEESKNKKLKIRKAWFVKDATTNKNRRWEATKAYLAGHYQWIKQYITRIDGSEVANTIKKYRDTEKMESDSIRRIEKDGSLDSYSEALEEASEINSIEDIEKYLDEAEKTFTATGFTENPNMEIVNGEQIMNVHNDEEIFHANMDGELVKVYAKGIKSIKKPEFVRVEVGS